MEIGDSSGLFWKHLWRCMARREADAPPLDDPEAWAKHPRLQRHVRCLLTSSKPENVLKRYEKARGQRFCVHVCAWVALLEDGELLESAVRVLTKMLKRRRGSLQPWLRGSLCLVGRRIRESPSWKELRKQMPRQCLRQSTSTSAGVEIERKPLESEQFTEPQLDQDKSTKLLQRAIFRWHNASCSARHALVEDLRRKLAQATAPGGQQKILASILRDLVAAMSPPRSKTRGEAAGGEPQSSDPSQRDVRQLLLTLLPWLDLSKTSVQASLQRLRCLMSQVPLADASSSKQWLDIHALLAGAFRSKSIKKARWKEDEKKEVLQFLQLGDHGNFSSTSHNPSTSQTLPRKAFRGYVSSFFLNSLHVIRSFSKA